MYLWFLPQCTWRSKEGSRKQANVSDNQRSWSDNAAYWLSSVVGLIIKNVSYRKTSWCKTILRSCLYITFCTTLFTFNEKAQICYHSSNYETSVFPNNDVLDMNYSDGFDQQLSCRLPSEIIFCSTLAKIFLIQFPLR